MLGVFSYLKIQHVLIIVVFGARMGVFSPQGSVDTDLMVGIGWLLMGCIIPISWEYILVANANERPLVSASVARTV